MSTDAIPTPAPDPAAEAALTDRERAALAACRAVLGRGEPLTWKAMAVALGVSSDWTVAAYRKLGTLRLIPWRGRGYRPGPPAVGADGLTDVEREVLHACRMLADATGRRVTHNQLMRCVRRHTSRVSTATYRLVALHLLDADHRPTASGLALLGPAAPVADAPQPAPAPPPQAAPQAAVPARVRPAVYRHDGPCRVEVRDFHAAWGRVRTLLPRREVAP